MNLNYQSLNIKMHMKIMNMAANILRDNIAYLLIRGNN